jgi:GTP-binding protein EngB required for normal cell division
MHSSQRTFGGGTFNDAQRLHLRISCEYMDKMLQRMEGVLHTGESASPFSRYQMDLSPAQGRVLEDYIRRLRSQILRTLAWQGIQPPPAQIPATRSIATDLHFIAIAISELRPYAMRGCGAMSEATAVELTGVLSELSSVVGQMMNYVKNEVGDSLQQRIEKIATGDEASLLLQRVERIVTAQGLVEFRTRIDLLLARLEDPTFEVAVFGRVSSGKSSFLNALLGTDILPVGINPITAVPTRIQHGSPVAAYVRLGNSHLAEVTLDRFRELISEAGNPGNQEGVRQALLKSPAARLTEGIVLVDTPGLGSLAVKGSRETLAYLPSCDLALLLIDAGNTLTIEDIGTLRLIQEARIPAIVLLSKADLLQEEDRLASIEYIKSQIQEQLRISIPVHPISALRECAAMVDQFYERELRPRFVQSHTLRLQSVKTKLVRLQVDVAASLEAKVQRLEAEQPIETAEIHALEKLLMDAAGRLATVARSLEDRILHLGFEAPQWIDQVAGKRAAVMRNGEAISISFADIARDLQALVELEVGAIVELLQETILQSVGEVQKVGRELKRSSLPDESEIVGLIRDAPRFELPVMPGSVAFGYWKLLGIRAMRATLLRALRSVVQPVLHKELGDYSATLGVWAKDRIRNVQFSVDSYADAYRAALQEMGPSRGSPLDTAQIRSDIAILMAEN